MHRLGSERFRVCVCVCVYQLNWWIGGASAAIKIRIF